MFEKTANEMNFIKENFRIKVNELCKNSCELKYFYQ